MNQISELIAHGAYVFLWQEYVPVSIFMALFSVVIAFTVEKEVG